MILDQIFSLVPSVFNKISSIHLKIKNRVEPLRTVITISDLLHIVLIVGNAGAQKHVASS